ncbi:hypothetical protein P154DRAFT_521416 [Amniculicola lignicola CBS 123094]|uniref:Uncharacterized protein n=1 Tax=Amniculicola lignicola CBS 123094 TaxID=1392246 RepID=A0A6A5WSC4_9PLEO|nr:hypothetical protein P154DRAFT_521416 [Amniculicola lignicola CBS 123094]
MATLQVSTAVVVDDVESKSPMSPSFSELKSCSTFSSDPPSSLHENEVRSTYHIYHKKECHACISTTIDPAKERCRGPTRKDRKAKRERKKLEAAQQADGTLSPTTTNSTISAEDCSFFLHTPYLAFHDPPRVLYIGDTKRCKPAVLIHTSAFWRTWKLQLGPSIEEPGVLDPRGVVSWKNNGGDKETLEKDGTLLKGYKVRTWRLWGETGKAYVHDVKTARKTGNGSDPDVLAPPPAVSEVDVEKAGSFASSASGEKMVARADEVVYLKWESPFSKDTRRYHFNFRGMDFYWKGTGTVKETRRMGSWLRYNHLKLIARIPATKGADEKEEPSQREVCLGKYTSSIAAMKAGTFELYDEAIWRLMVEHLPSVAQGRLKIPSETEKENEDSHEEIQDQKADVGEVKKTRLYQVIVATAMCMIIGEKQKRETVKKIIEGLITEGAGGGGGG